MFPPSYSVVKGRHYFSIFMVTRLTIYKCKNDNTIVMDSAYCDTYRYEQITRNIKKSTILFQRNKFVRTKMRLKEGTEIESQRDIRHI